MLLALIHWLADSTSLGWLRVFNYLTLRAVLAALTAFFIALALGPAVIRELRKLKVGQAVRQYGPKSHLVKEGTPTMGGILILIAVGVSTILWMDLSNRFVWVVLFVTLSFGAIGWVDDYRKVVHHDPEGSRLLALLLPCTWLFPLRRRGMNIFGAWCFNGWKAALPRFRCRKEAIC